MSPPWSPIGETTPRTRSSMRCGSSEGLRVLISSSSPTTRSTGLTSCREPTFLPLPRGVRMWSYTNASAMTVLTLRGDAVRGRPPIVTFLLSRSPVWCRCGPAHSADQATGRAGHGGERRGAARAAHARRADQPRRHERAQRPLLHDQGAGAAADPPRPLGLLHPRPRGPPRAGAGAAEPRLHALGDRAVRREHPRGRHPRGHRAAAHDAGALAAGGADRDVARGARRPRRADAQRRTT